MDTDWRSEWETALDDLELTVERADEILRGDHALSLPHWTPPAVQGPPPPDLVKRAQALLERQQNLITATASAVTSTRQQLEVAKKMATPRTDTPVYLDVNA